MKNILIFTSNYPYGTSETYLKDEIAYISEYANVTLVPLAVKDGSSKHRLLPSSVQIVLLKQTQQYEKVKMLIKTFFSKAFFSGICELVGCGKLSFKTISELVKFIYSGENHYQKVKSLLKENNIPVNKELIAYSYWMDSSSYMVSKLASKGCTSCCRAHGGDLYDERTPWKHQFLRKYLVEHIDFVCPVSIKGKEYLEKRVGLHNNIVPMHLGIEDDGVSNAQNGHETIIVSCSAAIELKRIDIIIEALSRINRKNIRWVHFGDGPQLEKLKSLAKEKLKNIEYEFFGQVSNSQLKEYYKTNSVKVFLNASETEGVPVSIMEAMSFGIPTIATDVGGVSELVKNGDNGFLVAANSAEELTNKLLFLLDMSDDEYLYMRSNARNSFLNNWEYKKNYKKFYDLITEGDFLCKDKKV